MSSSTRMSYSLQQPPSAWLWSEQDPRACPVLQLQVRAADPPLCLLINLSISVFSLSFSLWVLVCLSFLYCSSCAVVGLLTTIASATRGHDVTLFDSSAATGGQVWAFFHHHAGVVPDVASRSCTWPRQFQEKKNSMKHSDTSTNSSKSTTSRSLSLSLSSSFLLFLSSFAPSFFLFFQVISLFFRFHFYVFRCWFPHVCAGRTQHTCVRGRPGRAV